MTKYLQQATVTHGSGEVFKALILAETTTHYRVINHPKDELRFDEYLPKTSKMLSVIPRDDAPRVEITIG